METGVFDTVFARVYDPVIRIGDVWWFQEYRADIVNGLHGRILDLGTGTGAMLPFLHEGLHEGEIESIVSLEPDRYMLDMARQRMKREGVLVTFVRGRGEALPFDDEQFDFVLSTMVLCSVDGLYETIEEIVRVLRPGGELRVLEHVASTGWRGRVQRTVEPVWMRVAGGCRPHRSTDEVLQSHPALEVTRLDRLDIGVTPIHPFVSGWYTRKSK